MTLHAAKKLAILVAVLVIATVGLNSLSIYISTNAQEKQNTPAIVLASKKNDISTVLKLALNGNNVNASDPQGNTPLMYFAKKNNKYAVEKLLSCGADKFQKNTEGKNAWTIALESNASDVLPLVEYSQEELEQYREKMTTSTHKNAFEQMTDDILQIFNEAISKQ